MFRARKTLAQLSIAGTIAALGVLGAPASASATPVAPGLDCTTGSGGTFPSYYGTGTCTGTGKWLLRVSCSFGFTYDSPAVLNIDDTQSITYGSCNIGVDSVEVVPLRG